MQIGTRVHPMKLIVGFLIDYVRFSQLIPAICVQGIAVLFIFVSILILFQGYEGLWTWLVQLGFEENYHITSKDPEFWKTIISVYLIVTFGVDLLSTAYHVLTGRQQPKKQFIRTCLRWMIIPSFAAALLSVVFVMSSLSNNTSFIQLVGILAVFYVIAAVIVLYALGVDWVGRKMKEKLGS